MASYDLFDNAIAKASELVDIGMPKHAISLQNGYRDGERTVHLLLHKRDNTDAVIYYLGPPDRTYRRYDKDDTFEIWAEWDGDGYIILYPDWGSGYDVYTQGRFTGEYIEEMAYGCRNTYDPPYRKTEEW